MMCPANGISIRSRLSATTDLVARGAVKHLEIEGGKVTVTIKLGYPAAGIKEQLIADISAAINTVQAVEQVVVDLDWGIEASKTQNNMQQTTPALEADKKTINVAKTEPANTNENLCFFNI